MNLEVNCPACQTRLQLPGDGAETCICPKCQVRFTPEMFPPAPHSDEKRTGSPELAAITANPQIESDNEADLSRLKESHAKSYIVRRKWVADNERFVVFLVLSTVALAGFVLFIAVCAAWSFGL
jgi:uncharacterized Zn finger protein (UPF0148 family)